MLRPRLICLALSLALVSLAASAQDSPRRVLASCMSKRMGVDRTVSYLDAQRACKELLKAGDGKPQTAANTQSKPLS